MVHKKESRRCDAIHILAFVASIFVDSFVVCAFYGRKQKPKISYFNIYVYLRFIFFVLDKIKLFKKLWS